MTGAEHAPENDELSRNVLGIIDAYRMGAALVSKNRHPTGSTGATPAQPQPR